MNIRRRIGALELAQGQGEPWEHLTDAELQARIEGLSPVFRLEHGLLDDFVLTSPVVRQIITNTWCGVAS